MRSVGRVLREVERAYHALAARGADLLAVAHRTQDEAVEAYRAALARELADRFFLRDVIALRDAFVAAPPGSLPDVFEGLRTLPAALLDWLESTLEIVPHLEAGQRLEVPRSALGGFTLEGAAPPKSLALVKLAVLAPGWKRRGAVLLRPTVEWLDPMNPAVSSAAQSPE